MSPSPLPSWLSRLALALPLACPLGSALALPPAHAQPVPPPTRSADAARYLHNQVRRCQALPERDHAREDCLSRMNEPSAAHGSVESGGILREWRRAEEPQAPPAR